MSAETIYKKANRFAWQGRARTLIAVVILSSSSWGITQAADTNAAKGVNSMEMRKSMMQGMKDIESMPMTGDTDQDFAMMMKKHHQGGLDMANAELQYGKDAKLRNMAKKIVKSQKKEIEEFDQWLAKNKQPMGESMNK